MTTGRGTKLSDDACAAIRRLTDDLDEKNRRRVAGLLALVLGRGGVVALSQVTGLSHTTVEHGRRELLDDELGPRERVRAPGAGRKPAGKAPASSQRLRP